MPTASFTVKKNEPTKQERNGDYVVGSILHNRIYTNCRLEVKDKVAFIYNDMNVIEAVFSLDEYSILKS